MANPPAESSARAAAASSGPSGPGRVFTPLAHQAAQGAHSADDTFLLGPLIVAESGIHEQVPTTLPPAAAAAVSWLVAVTHGWLPSSLRLTPHTYQTILM